MGLGLLSGLLDGHAGVLDPRSKGNLRVPKAGTQGLSQHLVIGCLGPVHLSVRALAATGALRSSVGHGCPTDWLGEGIGLLPTAMLALGHGPVVR